MSPKRTKDSRTIGSRMWQMKGVRSVGGPTCRQRDDAVGQLGSVLKRVGKNREKMGSGGGLLPAVEGHSLE